MTEIVNTEVNGQVKHTILNSKFNPRILFESFSKCLSKGPSSDDYDDVTIRDYLVAYEEIVKFLEYLGQIFYFVVIDVKDKISIMQNYIETNPEHYETISKMVKYENENNMFENKGSAYKLTGGSRTILRLHRALIFIYKFLDGLYNADQKTKTSQVCIEAYDDTLAKYHSWIVKKTVRFGVIALPRRETLLDYMSDNNKEEFDKCFPQFIGRVEKVYDVTQNLYKKYNILDLV